MQRRAHEKSGASVFDALQPRRKRRKAPANTGELALHPNVLTYNDRSHLNGMKLYAVYVPSIPTPTLTAMTCQKGLGIERLVRVIRRRKSPL